MTTETMEPQKASPALWTPKQARDFLGWTERQLEYCHRQRPGSRRVLREAVLLRPGCAARVDRRRRQALKQQHERRPGEGRRRVEPITRKGPHDCDTI